MELLAFIVCDCLPTCSRMAEDVIALDALCWIMIAGTRMRQMIFGDGRQQNGRITAKSEKTPDENREVSVTAHLVDICLATHPITFSKLFLAIQNVGGKAPASVVYEWLFLRFGDDP